MKHANIALFLPHRGCPHQCSFCNQTCITGQQTPPDGDTVRRAAETALASGRCSPEHTEIAFFGGSFTALPVAEQLTFLQAAYPYVQKKLVRGIRISTRPDAIDEETLCRLRQYGVTAIELGAQSMDDAVLAANRRGHTARQTEQSSALIRQYGFSLGLQMMVGLPGDTGAGALLTAQQLAALQPDTMRIYPTLVLEGTPLAEQYRSGAYTPMTLEQAVPLCSALLDFFAQRQIRVIRLGLHDSEEVAGCLAGPYHPAFAQLCESHRFLQRVLSVLRENAVPKTGLRILVSDRILSAAIGQKRSNLQALQAAGYACEIIGEKTLAKTERYLCYQDSNKKEVRLCF